jgi:hypothetical protein
MGYNAVTEQDIRAQAAATQLKVDALDWMNKVSPKEEHPITCPSQDDTGHPARCSCGYDARHRVAEFIRSAIMKA